MKSANGLRARLADVPLGKARIQSLSDGVFAVSMTLLILQVKIPEMPGHAAPSAVMQSIGDMVPALLSFLATFLLAGAFWYLQHLTFHFIRQPNPALVGINLGFLLFVAMLPFTGAMLSRFPAQATAHFLYFGNLLALGLMLNWHWYYAIRHYMVDPEMDVDVTHRVSSWLRVLPSACALALPLTIIRTDLSFYAFVWVLLLEPFIERWRRPRKSVRPPAPKA